MTENEFRERLIESGLSPNARLVAFVLLQFRNRVTGECYPSQVTLSDACGLAKNTIIKAISELEENGYLKISKKRIKGQKFTCNFYHFDIHGSPRELSNELSIELSYDLSIDGAPDAPKPIEPIKPINNPIIPNKNFEQFWEIFPKQRAGSKQKAESAYLKALKRDSAENIHNGLMRYIRSDEVARGYAKGAAAWLNDDRWMNQYDPPTSSPPQPPRKPKIRAKQF